MNIQFVPVRTTEDKLPDKITNGYIYFTTDTGKIFIDTIDNRINVGGSAGAAILYGDFPKNAEPNEETEKYYFSKQNLSDQNVVPRINDLVLNSDGRFYRIDDVNEDELICILLSVSGGSTNPSTLAQRTKLTLGDINTYLLNNQEEILIPYTVEAEKDAQGLYTDDKTTVTWILEEKLSTGVYLQYASEIIPNIPNAELQYLNLKGKLRESTTSRLTLQAKSKNGDLHEGLSPIRDIELVSSDLTLTMSTQFSTTKTYPQTMVPISFSINGQVDKIVDIYVGKGEATPTLIDTLKFGKDKVHCTWNLHEKMALSHGYYKVSIQVYQSINGVRNLSITPKEFELAVYEVGNEKPIIWLGNYQKEYYNYDDIKIPFLVYDPKNMDITQVHLQKDGNDIEGSPRDEKGSDHTQYCIFEITDAQMNVRNYYSISCGDDERKTTRNIEFKVSQDPNRSMAIETQGLFLNFDAKGRTNSESMANRTRWVYGDIVAEFNNFNWYNNGWMPDKDGNTCLRISNGAQFILPVGKTIIGKSSVGEDSIALEMQFKVRNVQDYTPLIHNITRYVGDDDYYNAFIHPSQTTYSNYDSFLAWYLPQLDPPVLYDDLEFDYVQKEINATKAIATYIPSESDTKGLCIGSQDAFFSNGINTVDVSFIEDEMVYLTAVYTHSNEPANRLLMIYINGILTGVINSSLDDFIEIGNDKFIFNSEYCDIDLYKMRIYKTNLTLHQVLNNYAVDKKDIVLFDQNNLKNGFIIDDASIGELRLSFDGVEEYNSKPENKDKYTMPYIIFDTSMNGEDAAKLSWSKENPVQATITFVNTGLDRAYERGELEELAIKDGLCTKNDNIEVRQEAVRNYYKHHCPSWTGDDIEVVVQGTSSEFYPRRNYKIKAKDDDDNVHIFLNRGPYANDYVLHGNSYLNNPCHTKFWYLDNYNAGTTKWTMKIDYMESSGSYNTGFANLVANAYSKHPLQDYENRIVDDNGAAYIGGAITEENWEKYCDSLRTSVQGFPVMAFHKKANNGDANDYVYIGRYNMNLDKGSAECYGFKPNEIKNSTGDTVKMYMLDTNGQPQRVKEIAECWEMQNNNHGYCSFRDPWNRPELSFSIWNEDGSELNNARTGWGSPLVADSFEERYSTYDDALKRLWELSKNTSIKNKVKIFKNLGWIEESEGDTYDLELDGQYFNYGTGERWGQSFEQLYNYYSQFTADNYKPAQELFIRLLENWEKACAWVWSTNIDNAMRGGTYNLAEVAKVLYTPNTYYILTEDEEGNPIYILDPNESYIEGIIYYDEPETDEEGFAIAKNAWVTNNPNLVYKANAFYIKMDDVYILQTGPDFNETFEYYTFEKLSDDKMDELIATGNSAVIKHTKKLTVPITYEGIEYKYDTQEYRLAKFRNELSKHFDIEYLATYFVMTEVFECYDSRGKNCMMASWGPHVTGGDYIWYPIFYDIDTQLGINNTGIPSFEYNVDATEEGNYSTSDSILWNNFYKCFKTTYILEKYKQLRGKSVDTFEDIKTPILKSVDKIEKWYQCDPDECGSMAMKGHRPLVAINLDEYFKYISIYNPAGTKSKVDITSPIYGLTGRISDSGDYVVETTRYYYALQGNRSLSRRQFLSNRLEYIDSWLNVGNYARGGYNRLWGRISARRPQSANSFLNSDQWYEVAGDDSTSYFKDAPAGADGVEKRWDFDSEYWATLTPIRNSYVTIQDDAAAYPSQKFNGTPIKMEFDALKTGIRTSQDYNEQLCYIYGINQMKDVGNLYRMYWQEFKIEGEANKLTKLILGCDGLMTYKDADGSYKVYVDENGDTPYGDDPTKKAYRWFNNKMNLPSMPSASYQTGMPLLKEANFCNIQIKDNGPVLDLTSCEKLENFRATGSNFAQVKFADGVALSTLYLPYTITSLQLKEARLLTKIVDTYEYPEYQVDGSYTIKEGKEGLFIEGITNNDTTKTLNLHTLSLEGDNMGYDSYRLLEKYYNRFHADTETKRKITMTGVNWCPYVQLVEGDNYDDTKSELFKRDNEHYGFDEYIYTNKTIFDADVLNGLVYKYNPDLATASQAIASTEMFTELNNHHTTKIEGTVFVHNAEAIDEMTINALNANNKYPKMKLFYGGTVNKAYSAKFVLPLECVDEENNYWTYEYVPVKNSSELSIQKVSADEYKSTENIFDSPFKLYSPSKSHHDFLGWSTDPTGQTNLIPANDEEAWKAFIIPSDQYSTTFYAIYRITNYPITFITGVENNNPTQEVLSHAYGSFITAPTRLPWISDSNLQLEETYGFMGYTTIEPNGYEKDKSKCYHISTDTSLVQDFSIEKVTGPRTYFPIFNIMSVYNNVHPHLFNIDTSTGYISWNNDYSIKGKLTIPYQIGNTKVVGIKDNGFNGNLKYSPGMIGVTHIFWSDKNGSASSSFTALGNGSSSDYSFAGLINLVYFQMPPTITTISYGCFNGCTSLFKGEFSIESSVNYAIEKTFKNITEIMGYSFVNTPIAELVIPEGVQTLGYRCFRSMSNLTKVIIKTTSLNYDTCGFEIFSNNSSIAEVDIPVQYKTLEWMNKFNFDESVNTISSI